MGRWGVRKREIQHKKNVAICYYRERKGRGVRRGKKCDGIEGGVKLETRGRERGDEKSESGCEEERGRERKREGIVRGWVLRVSEKTKGRKQRAKKRKKNIRFWTRDGCTNGEGWL